LAGAVLARRPRLRPLRGGPRRSRRLARFPVRRRGGPVELPVRAGVAPPTSSSTRSWRATRASTPSRPSPPPFPCGSSPTLRASLRRAGRTCSRTATTPSTPSARATTWSPRRRPEVTELSGWVNA